MPTKVTVTGANAGVLDYVYSADGVKLQKKKTVGGNTTTTDYVGGYVYENNTLKQITHPEGYIERNGNAFQYVYRLTDIWGNTRVTFADDNNDGSVTSSEIRKEQNYYPFGLEHKGYNSNSYGVKNNLKTYQKQEFTEDLGLNTHEWRYRVSDPAIGRFWQIDPLAEDYTYNSTYAFAENKLGSGIELEGLEIFPFPINSPLLGVSDAVMLSDGGKILNTGRISAARSNIGRAVGRTSESAARLSQNQRRGNATEVQQLARNNLTKNTEKFTRTDPKTGKDATTIPDGMKPNGGTVEIKHVQKQSLTRQLRIQKEVSNGNGVKPELIINKGAKLSEPLKNAGFDIKTYQTLPIKAKDGTNIKLNVKPLLPKKAIPLLRDKNGKPIIN